MFIVTVLLLHTSHRAGSIHRILPHQAHRGKSFLIKRIEGNNTKDEHKNIYIYILCSYLVLFPFDEEGFGDRKFDIYIYMSNVRRRT